MIRNPNFHIQMKKRKWKTILFLLRKRKRKSIEPDTILNPNLPVHNHHHEEEDVYFDAIQGDTNDDVVLDKIEEFEEFAELGNEKQVQSSKTLFSEDITSRNDDKSLKPGALVVVSKKDGGGDKPPDDDCCPICFENFNIACKTNCGHWFCANCILRFWTYRTVLQKCNCPICARPISKLTPEASLLTMREVEVVEVIKNVQRYNRLFQGGVNGVIRKFFEVPNVFRRMLCCLMDPDRFRGNYYAMRSFALLMSCIYNISSLDFIPTGLSTHLHNHHGARGDFERFFKNNSLFPKGTLGVRRLFDLCAVALVVILCLVGVCHRLLLRRRVRRLEATQL